VKDKIDAWNRSSEVQFEVCVPIDEFDSTMEYLTKVLKISEDDIYSHLDNPEEAVIEVFLLPF
jgi:hypothetical protein